MANFYAIKNKDEQPKLLMGNTKNCFSVNLDDIINNSNQYDPELTLESFQWYEVEYDDKIFPDYLNSNGWDNNMGKIKLEDIRYIWIKDDEQMADYFVINRKEKRIVAGTSLIFGDKISISENDEGIRMGEFDGVYIRKNRHFYFKKIESLNYLFDFNKIIFRNATQDEINNFLNEDFIELNNFNSDEVGQLNRKNIKIAIEKLRTFDDRQKDEMIKYVIKNAPELKASKRKIKIMNDKQLTLLLHGINQRYYDLPITGEPVIATSIQKRKK